MSHATARDDYVQAVLDLYRTVPGVLGHVRRADRELAARFYASEVPFHAIRNAFIVAAARRVRHNAFSTPMPPIRSLAYFAPVIREMLDRPLGHREIEDLRRILPGRELPL